MQERAVQAKIKSAEHVPHVGIPKVTLSIIAATNDSGRYANAGMHALAIIKTPIEDKIAEILDVAPFVMFKLVRAKAAVQGKPPARPVRGVRCAGVF